MSGKRTGDSYEGDTLLDVQSAPTIDASEATSTLPWPRSSTLASPPASERRRDRPFAVAESEPRLVEASIAPPSLSDLTTRYAMKRVLGEGGMGEVRLTGDAFIGREVAMKVVRTHAGKSPEARARFLREARVQGQLEHPSVVPVYDIGTTDTGELYFTMKRIGGLTLEEIVDRLRAGEETVVSAFTRRRLLAALSQVCLALAYAHTRGVVHRDLKPANVMLGDFGEVYVLDWGIAKVANLADLPSETTLDGDGPVAETRAGTLLGTPGYMAPEQARGEASSVDGRADVYSLGAILFELLTLEPLHRGRSVLEIVAATVQLPEGRPRDRASDLPPELDDICARATALAVDDRFADAREMHAAIERFLDGERDLERRRELAQSHAEEAARTLASLENAGPEAEPKRVNALRSLGAALALDPDQKTAQRALVELLVDDSSALPEAAEKELLEVNLRDRSSAARRSIFAYASWLIMFPLALWMGVRSWPALLTLGAVLLSLCTFLYWVWRTGHAHPRYLRNWMPVNFVAVGLLSMFFGPLVIVPQVAVASASAMIVGIRANALTRRAIIGLAVACILVPLGLSWFGVIPRMYSVEGDALVIRAWAVGFPPIPTFILLIASSVYAIVLSVSLLGQGTDAMLNAERKTHARAYRLRQMFPSLEAGVSEP